MHLIQATLSELQAVPNSAVQRRAIQTEAQRIYRQYKLELQSTNASFPELFDEHYLGKLYDNLDKLILQSDKAVQRLPGLRPNRGQNSSPRLFPAEDNHYYIGDYTPASGNAPELITVHSAEGSVVRRFESVGERWRPQAPATPARPQELRDLKQTATQLIEDLDSFRRRVRGYIKPDTLPADLEDMMIAKANELQNCATRIEAIGGNAADTTALRTQAARLRQEGVQLRIEQIKVSPRPNEGHLAYLDGLQQIGIRKLGNARCSKPATTCRSTRFATCSQPASLCCGTPTSTTVAWIHRSRTSMPPISNGPWTAKRGLVAAGPGKRREHARRDLAWRDSPRHSNPLFRKSVVASRDGEPRGSPLLVSCQFAAQLSLPRP
nr:hypothetical protein [Pseudomonas sp. BIGb0427]